MKIKHVVRAALLGVAVAAVAASSALASADIMRAMTDPCAKAMSWPVRSMSYSATPLSERGLQCPIQEQFGAPLND